MINLKQNFNFRNISAINFINLSDKEKELVRKWRNHPDIRKWGSNVSLVSLIEHRDFLKKLRINEKDFYWLLKERSSGYLGVICLKNVDYKNKNAYLGIYACPYLRGVGHKLMAFLKALAFKKARLHTLKLEVLEENERAIAFYVKEGFKQEGVLKEIVFRSRRWQDMIIMGIINDKR